MPTLRSIAFIAFLCTVLPASAYAQYQYNAASNSNAYQRAAQSSLQQAYIVPYAGYFDITQDDNAALQLGVEYRFAPHYWTLRPAVGLNVSTDGSMYGYGGVFWDIEMGRGWWLTPNFVAGLYHSGGGKSLGGAVEFRSGIEVSYELANQHRIGLAFNHISNASIYDRNPGAETLLLNYHVPVGNLF